ncbi:MAG: T9SS type A sorting domain-containing protein [Melioribacteraceae bacterium]|nr:T9SS type A sorting domain-containing protein [Melioribacteraceae bacterium]MCF8264795.1 T9SS type A sorting domain-containing protein [Melioribacteraceae bacterium]
MKRVFIIALLLFLPQVQKAQNEPTDVKTNPPIYIAFLWHMHQPIYYPYKSITETENLGVYSFSVVDVHNQRIGPYTNWPKDAIQKGIDAGLPHLGAEVSFSGSLIENLNNLESNGNGNFTNWKSNWTNIISKKTSLGNSRINLIGFGYHHPLMGLIEYEEIRKQIDEHKIALKNNFGMNEYSKGIFPPENAFAPVMIPALVDEGLEWVLVDNIHFERAAKGYPFSTGGNLYEPNKADQINENPDDWISLQDVWAGTQVSAQWSSQPRYVKYIDPETGAESKIIAVPTDRYLGNEDGRGGFGALQYEKVMSQFESYNNDPDHPILIVLHHDGDNYGGGSSGYYGSNFQAFVDWVKNQPDRFVATTIQDYLDQFPPDPNEVVHIESGSWSGADNGDPEFKKWLGDPGSDSYSPDRNSWGVVTAATNFVRTAEQAFPNDSRIAEANKYLLNSQASDYWYWDGTEIWDSNPTRGANIAIQQAEAILVSSYSDDTPPTIFQPQREPYNPGGTEWNTPQASDFTVWTYVFDVNGVDEVKLKYRIDLDGENDKLSNHNETYDGGNDVGDWNEIVMTGNLITSKTNPLPAYKALEYTAKITGIKNSLVDYYVEATDQNGNIEKSPISHVWVGANESGGGSGGTGNPSLTILPEEPSPDDTITIKIENANVGAKLHWGVNDNGDNWQTPDEIYRPTGSELFNGSGPAVQSPFIEVDTNGTLEIKIGPFNKPEQQVVRLAFVIYYLSNDWDNNNGQNYHIVFGNDTTNTGGEKNTFVLDGSLDSRAALASSNDGIDLYLAYDEPFLYVATQKASQQGGDIFLFVSENPSTFKNAPWAKNGQVASWDAYIANESSNDYNVWNDYIGATEISVGAFLEGTINLKEEFGTVPENIYAAIGRYGTNDGGNLTGQSPSGNGDGNIDASEYYIWDYSTIITKIHEDKSSLPTRFSLSQNYPNPFNPSTTIKFTIPIVETGQGSSQRTVLKIYDVLGSNVATLVDNSLSPGVYSVTFDANHLSNGVYFYKLTSGNFVEVKKMMFVK